MKRQRASKRTLAEREHDERRDRIALALVADLSNRGVWPTSRTFEATDHLANVAAVVVRAYESEGRPHARTKRATPNNGG